MQKDPSMLAQNVSSVLNYGLDS